MHNSCTTQWLVVHNGALWKIYAGLNDKKCIMHNSKKKVYKKSIVNI